MKLITGTIKGVAPFIMCNSRMASPTDKFALALQQVSRKRTKTEADHAEIARIQFLGHCYVDEKGKIVMPAANVKASWRDAAHATEKNSKKLLLGALIPDTLFFPLKYDGPTDPDKLWERPEFVDTRLVRRQNQRVNCTRPIFYEWAVPFRFMLDESVINPSLLERIIENAGMRCGIGDFKPEFGRYELAEFKAVEF